MRLTYLLFQSQPAQQATLKQWLNVSTPTARNIVRSILKEKSPIHSHELFEKTQEVTLDPKVMQQRKEIYERLLRRQEQRPPPNPLHPIRSLRYLKTVVLPDLVERGEAEKIVNRRDPTPEELDLIKHTKPLTLRQRKMRGAIGPGKQPPLYVNKQVQEWLWNITEQGQDTPPERELSDLRFGLLYDKDKLLLQVNVGILDWEETTNSPTDSSHTVDIPKELKDAIRKFRFARRNSGSAAMIIKVNKKDLIMEEVEQFDSISLEDLAEELPENSPRYILFSYELNHPDGRKSFPLVLINWAPTTSETGLLTLHASAYIDFQTASDVSKVIEIRDGADSLTKTAIDAKLLSK
ncbi:hypothetical protein Clacol_006832 [Clathrus columnatus]|uniref:ADF-H domain-containing protein n=1 Tax=Clathrus columnatus TaxID=1419009 RepID=A0AAV5AHF6_9AGAM|nr:hypothetical protein Clacol_006832 [Clathrus columnatus]